MKYGAQQPTRHLLPEAPQRQRVSGKCNQAAGGGLNHRPLARRFAHRWRAWLSVSWMSIFQ
jgi:hypothetical protein